MREQAQQQAAVRAAFRDQLQLKLQLFRAVWSGDDERYRDNGQPVDDRHRERAVEGGKRRSLAGQPDAPEWGTSPDQYATCASWNATSHVAGVSRLRNRRRWRWPQAPALARTAARLAARHRTRSRFGAATSHPTPPPRAKVSRDGCRSAANRPRATLATNRSARVPACLPIRTRTTRRPTGRQPRESTRARREQRGFV